MAAKKAATKQPAKAKAGITAEQLAAFMGIDTAKAKGLKVYCEAAKNVCNSFAGLSLQKATWPPWLCCICCMVADDQSKNDQRAKRFLSVRYMIVSATEEAKADGFRGSQIEPPNLRSR